MQRICYDAPRMAGDSAQRERNLLHDGEHSSKCARYDMEHTLVIISLASSYYDSSAALLLIDLAAEEQQAQLRTSFEIRVSFHGDVISLHETNWGAEAP